MIPAEQGPDTPEACQLPDLEDQTPLELDQTPLDLDDTAWDAFVPDDDQCDPLPDYGDFWIDRDELAP